MTELADWMPLDQAIEILGRIRRNSWPAVPETKYIEIRIDTRDMACLVFASNCDGYKTKDERKLDPSPPRMLIGGNGYDLEDYLQERMQR